MPSLEEAAVRYACDKRRGLHGYTRFYERHLASVKVGRLLEIGVYMGASLRMWAECFPEAEIHGIDIEPQCKRLEIPGHAKVHILDQGDRVSLGRFAERFGDFDLVVDDGSHRTGHQIASFEVLWPHVVPGGLYVVEDVFTSFWAQFKDPGPTAFEYFQALSAQKLRGHWYSDQARTDVDMIEFSVGLIVVRKSA